MKAWYGVIFPENPPRVTPEIEEELCRELSRYYEKRESRGRQK